MYNPFAFTDLARQHRDQLMEEARQHRMARAGPRSGMPAIAVCGTGEEALDVRVLEPSDLGQITRLFERLSSRSRYLRFFSPLEKLPPATIRYLASVDHDRHEALGAFDDRGLVGSAHYFRSADDATAAEISLEIVDDHQRHGVGKCLLRALARLARQRGITHFTATVLTDNRAAVAMLRQSGWPTVSRLSGPEITFAMTLPPLQDEARSA